MATKWEPFHQRGSCDVDVSRNDGLVMRLATAINPIAAAALTDSLKLVFQTNPDMADRLIEVATLYQA